LPLVDTLKFTDSNPGNPIASWWFVLFGINLEKVRKVYLVTMPDYIHYQRRYRIRL